MCVCEWAGIQAIFLKQCGMKPRLKIFGEGVQVMFACDVHACVSMWGRPTFFPTAIDVFIVGCRNGDVRM